MLNEDIKSIGRKGRIWLATNRSHQSQNTEDNTADIAKSVKLSDEERLQKVISRAGIASRREAEKMILDGRVSVNGKIVTEQGSKIKPRKDTVVVDGKKLQIPDAQSIFWVIVYKPKDTLTTLEDSNGKDRTTIADLVPKARELRLLPVGRLERGSSGLLLLTNENGWIHPLTHPSFGNKRRYEVVAQGTPTDEDLNKIRAGVSLPFSYFPEENIDEEKKSNYHDKKKNSREKCKASNIKIIEQDTKNGLTLLDITLEDSRPSQIEQMLETIMCKYVSSKRIGYGPLTLKGLRKGQWRELSKVEIMKLKKACKPPPGISLPSSREEEEGLEDETISAKKEGNRGKIKNKDEETLQKLRQKNMNKRTFRGRAGSADKVNKRDNKKLV